MKNPIRIECLDGCVSYIQADEITSLEQRVEPVDGKSRVTFVWFGPADRHGRHISTEHPDAIVSKINHANWKDGFRVPLLTELSLWQKIVRIYDNLFVQLIARLDADRYHREAAK